MTRAGFGWAVTLLLGAATGCRDVALSSTHERLSFSVASLNFGSLYVGQNTTLSAEIRNEGLADLAVAWVGPDAPFRVSALPAQMPAGEWKVEVTFTAAQSGTFQSQLTGVSSPQTPTLLLVAEAVDPPACPTAVTCHSVTFDLGQGVCRDLPLPDGTPCDAHDVCLSQTSCQGGRCVGIARNCDDSNPCTTDVCDAVAGCLHPPAPPCPGDGNCLTGVCNPVTGCGLAPAPDGTVCGSVDCNSANVCIAGACTVRTPPDGFVCAQASPCQGEGRCASNNCVRPPPGPIQQQWSFDSSAANANTALHDFVLEDDGSISLMGFFQKPALRANTANAVLASDTARRCILWNDKLACADYFGSGQTGKVSLLDLGTGIPDWTLDLVQARPDFAMQTSPGHLFMARVASLGSDHLAALFEGFPASTPNDTLCRNYFLVILDTAGSMVAAEPLSDPMFQTCNHPHPFGMASDAQGRLYIAFSPATPGGAPLVPLNPTLVMAFEHDGTLLWKREDGITGGELATARGLLFPERGAIAYATATGVTRALPAGKATAFGRPVVTLDRLTASPTPAAAVHPTELFGYHADTLQPAWTYALPLGDTFLSDQIRLADMYGGPNGRQSEVLAFATRAGTPSLMAVDAESGAELWSCPLDFRSTNPPQTFEVAQDTVGLMEGAMTCGDCDPPFAGSRGLFRTLSVPGLLPPVAPWPGVFGGASHGHHEQLVVAPASGVGN